MYLHCDFPSQVMFLHTVSGWEGALSVCPHVLSALGPLQRVQNCLGECCVPSFSMHSQCFHPIEAPDNCLASAKPFSGATVRLIMITICLAVGNMGAGIRYALWDPLIVTSTTSRIFALINDSHQEQSDE